MKSTDNGGHEFTHKDLLLCPFCGGTPKIKFIGNNFTKSRKVTISCSVCRIQRTDATIFHNHIWIAEIAIEHWNERVDK